MFIWSYRMNSNGTLSSLISAIVSEKLFWVTVQNKTTTIFPLCQVNFDERAFLVIVESLAILLNSCNLYPSPSVCLGAWSLYPVYWPFFCHPANGILLIFCLKSNMKFNTQCSRHTFDRCTALLSVLTYVACASDVVSVYLLQSDGGTVFQWEIRHPLML